MKNVEIIPPEPITSADASMSAALTYSYNTMPAIFPGSPNCIIIGEIIGGVYFPLTPPKQHGKL